MSEKWIEIARTGTFTDSAGRSQTFTAADLAAITNAYDPQKRDCPLVFGHPQSDSAPAFGWATQLKTENDKLFAQFAQVPREVRELVAKGHYRHVSMSLMPDRKTLRHVALLGACQPAIDCLKAVELRSGQQNCITVDFARMDAGCLAEGAQQAPRSLQATPERPAGSGAEGYAEKDCLKAVELRSGQQNCITVDFAKQLQKDSTMPDDDAQRQIGALKERLAALEKENTGLKQQLAAHKGEKDKADADKKAAEEKAAKAEADFAAYRGQVEHEKREARVSALVAAGKLKPAEKAGVLQFAAALAIQTEPIDFAAPDGTVSKISMEEKYMRELEAREPDPRFAEFAGQPLHARQQADEINPSELTAKL